MFPGGSKRGSRPGQLARLEWCLYRPSSDTLESVSEEADRSGWRYYNGILHLVRFAAVAARASMIGNEATQLQARNSGKKAILSRYQRRDSPQSFLLKTSTAWSLGEKRKLDWLKTISTRTVSGCKAIENESTLSTKTENLAGLKIKRSKEMLQGRLQ